MSRKLARGPRQRGLVPVLHFRSLEDGREFLANRESLRQKLLYDPSAVAWLLDWLGVDESGRAWLLRHPIDTVLKASAIAVNRYSRCSLFADGVLPFLRRQLYEAKSRGLEDEIELCARILDDGGQFLLARADQTADVRIGCDRWRRYLVEIDALIGHHGGKRVSGDPPFPTTLDRAAARARRLAADATATNFSASSARMGSEAPA